MFVCSRRRRVSRQGILWLATLEWAGLFCNAPSVLQSPAFGCKFDPPTSTPDVHWLHCPLCLIWLDRARRAGSLARFARPAACSLPVRPIWREPVAHCAGCLARPARPAGCRFCGGSNRVGDLTILQSATCAMLRSAIRALWFDDFSAVVSHEWRLFLLATLHTYPASGRRRRGGPYRNPPGVRQTPV